MGHAEKAKGASCWPVLASVQEAGRVGVGARESALTWALRWPTRSVAVRSRRIDYRCTEFLVGGSHSMSPLGVPTSVLVAVDRAVAGVQCPLMALVVGVATLSDGAKYALYIQAKMTADITTMKAMIAKFGAQ